MIYFLYGADTFRSRKKLREIVSEFRKKSGGDLGVARIDAEERPEAVLSVGRTASLFAPKELFVIENPSSLPADLQEYVTERVKSWKESKDVTVIFWEAEVDEKKTPIVKEIKKAAAKSQEFKLLSPVKVGTWVLAEAAARGIRLSPREKELLASRLGGNLWAVANELEKIASGWMLNAEVREEEKMWNMTDAFLKNRRSAFRPLASLLENGRDPIYLIGVLASALRTLAEVQQGIAGGKENKVIQRLNPYVARKNVELARSADAARLKEFFFDLAEADLALKTGKLPSPLPLVKLTLKK